MPSTSTTIRTVSGNCPRCQGEEYPQAQSPVLRGESYLRIYCASLEMKF